MAMLPARKIIAAFIGVFLMGALVGWLVALDLTDTKLSHFFQTTSDPDSMAARINQKYVKDYQLTPDEQSRIAPLTEEMTRQLYQDKRQFGIGVMATLDDYHGKIAEQMTPDQRALYEKANDERKKRMNSMLLLDQTSPAQGQK